MTREEVICIEGFVVRALLADVADPTIEKVIAHPPHFAPLRRHTTTNGRVCMGGIVEMIWGWGEGEISLQRCRHQTSSRC